MSDSRSLTRMPVYDVSNGRVIGRVHRLIVDPDARKVAGLLLATRLGREARCLPFRSIHAVGEHAVTVRGMDAIVRLSELPDMEEMFRTRRRIYHSPVLTEDGTFIGDVDEFTVNPQTGRIETLLVSGGMVQDLFRRPTALPAHLVLTIGEDATIVRDQTVAMLHHRHAETSAPAKGGRRAKSVTDGTEPSLQQIGADGGTGTRADRRPVRWTAPWHRWLRRKPVVLAEDESAAPENKPGSRADDTAAPGPTAENGSNDSPAQRPKESVVQLRHEARLQEHRAQNADDVFPSVAADRGEGGDGKA